jgi:hypothetical protein
VVRNALRRPGGSPEYGELAAWNANDGNRYFWVENPRRFADGVIGRKRRGKVCRAALRGVRRRSFELTAGCLKHPAWRDLTIFGIRAADSPSRRAAALVEGVADRVDGPGHGWE